MMNDDYFAEKEKWEKNSNEPDKKVELIICVKCNSNFVALCLMKVQYCPFCQTVNYTR